VHVTLVEVLRIVLPVGLAIDDVVERIPADGARGHLQTVPLPLDEGEVRLVLRQRGEPKTCVFQHHVGARGLCSVHALRPGVCRIFPYRVDVGDRIVSAGAAVACPTRWLFNESVEARVEADMQQWQDDVAEERALVAAWRETEEEDRSFAGLVRFATARLAPRYGLDPKEFQRPARRRLGDRWKKPAGVEEGSSNDPGNEPR
jgi:Fe-S-cluster containining protein